MRALSIPNFTEQGILPEGVHICTLENIKETFSTIPNQNIRSNLFSTLENLIHDLRSTSILIKGLIIDGSYVTNKTVPSDIDIAIIFCDSIVKMDLPQRELCFFNSEYIKEFYGFSMFPILGEGNNLEMMIEFYQQQEPPYDDFNKGMLRVNL